MVSTTAGQLVGMTIDKLAQRFPAMAGYSEQQRRHTIDDIAHIVDFLAAALYVDDDELFTGFIGWTADILTARGVPASTLNPALEILASELTDFPRVQRIVTAALHTLAATATDPSLHA